MSLPEIILEYELLPEAANLCQLVRMTAGSAGFDIVALKLEPTELLPNQRILVATGLKVKIPTGYVGLICSRSGLAINHGVTVLNAPGIIDSDYRDELKVILHNTAYVSFTITRGMRIAQLCLVPQPTVKLQLTTVTADTQRVGGFGSTGY